jgi:hypothetical protein
MRSLAVCGFGAMPLLASAWGVMMEALFVRIDKTTGEQHSVGDWRGGMARGETFTK